MTSDDPAHDGFRVTHDERGVVTITLDVPEKMSRVSMDAREQLAELFDELGDDPEVRAIVLIGAGEKAFTAGPPTPRRSPVAPDTGTPR